MKTFLSFLREFLTPSRIFGLACFVGGMVGLIFFVRVELEQNEPTGLVPIFSVLLLIIGIILFEFADEIFPQKEELCRQKEEKK